jgi:hypothetical protein
MLPMRAAHSVGTRAGCAAAACAVGSDTAVVLLETPLSIELVAAAGRATAECLSPLNP